MLVGERRASYKIAGAKVATLGELLGPKVVAKGLTTGQKYGVQQGRTVGHPAQLGGAMVVLPSGEVAWSHMSQDASDSAETEEILAAVRATSASHD